MSATDAAALYDGCGVPITPGAPPWDGEDGMFLARPVCSVFSDADGDFDGTVDLIWALPTNPDPQPIPNDILGQIVAVLDRNGAIAMHAASQAAIYGAIDAFLPLTGGGRS